MDTSPADRLEARLGEVVENLNSQLQTAFNEIERRVLSAVEARLAAMEARLDGIREDIDQAIAENDAGDEDDEVLEELDDQESAYRPEQPTHQPRGGRDRGPSHRRH